ncbi:iron ABC transporter permease [Ammoniphilus sp. YIM 78166]|uniref:FecCD family ABC transporter permease n=1 Tax=Ammoniphilus sp. YIM 78166 TaxID=1644106 RepID=UPI001F0FF0B3|nr:iron ABC transporter permease [Ammoniphilus sp. YIM 78166]
MNLIFLKTKAARGPLFLVASSLILLILLPAAITVGAANIELPVIWEAITRYDSNILHHQIIRDIRIPRELSAALVGAAFAVAGAIMQGMTRNPLADSGLLGLNAGAALLLAICFAFFPGIPFIAMMAFSFLGAGVGASLVFGISFLVKGGLSPLRLTLAGAAVSAFLAALAQGIALYANVAKELTFWIAGGVAVSTWDEIRWMAPIILIALILALFISKQITILSFGHEVSTGLGQNTLKVKAIAILVVLMLAGTAVATIGSIAFVGLIVPHIVRFFVGVDYRWVIPGSAVAGAILLVFADILARTINPPFETPIGAIISLISVPFFIYLTARGRKPL